MSQQDISEMDRILYSFCFGYQKMLHEGTHMFIEGVPATDVEWFQLGEFDTDVQIAPTTISARVANHKDCIQRHIFSTKSGFLHHPLDRGLSNRYGIRVIRREI